MTIIIIMLNWDFHFPAMKFCSKPTQFGVSPKYNPIQSNTLIESMTQKPGKARIDTVTPTATHTISNSQHSVEKKREHQIFELVCNEKQKQNETKQNKNQLKKFHLGHLQINQKPKETIKKRIEKPLMGCLTWLRN